MTLVLWESRAHTHTHIRLVWRSFKQVLHCDSYVGAAPVFFFFVFFPRCFLYLKNREETCEPVLFCTRSLKLMTHFISFHFAFAHVYSAVPPIFVASASPAFWAVICVHNKQVEDKEFKLRLGLTFLLLVFSIIQQEAWGRLTTGYTERDKAGITC